MTDMPLEPKKGRTERAHVKIEVNLVLFATAFTIFTFIGVAHPELLQSSSALSLQLTVAIPLIGGSTFARSKLVTYERDADAWERYGFLTFLLGYSFLVNSVGIMLALFTRPNIAIAFFILNFVLAITYSVMEVAGGDDTIWSRASKDSLFIAICVIGGILPVLGIL